VVKFNSSGVRQWGTYYGGENVEIFTSVCIDGTGNLYAGGGIINPQLGTWTVLATPGAHQTLNGGGYSDALLVKFDASGARQWATYYGGKGEDMGNACACDKQGNVYLSGATESSVAIATSGSHQSNSGGASDAFLVKFNSSGVQQWATYYGGTGDDSGNGCATDTSGYIYLAGESWSGATGVISTPGAHQVTYGTGSDGFLVKFDGSGLRQWGTYYGGNSWESIWFCSTDLNNNIFVGGCSGSVPGTVIATPGSHQTSGGGSFISKFNSGGIRQWGSYYNGTGGDGGYAGATDKSGSVYLAGTTYISTGTLVSSPGSHQQLYGGGNDAYLVKFYDCSSDQPVSVTPPANQTVCENSTATLITISQGGTAWYATPTSTNALFAGAQFITPVLSAGVYTYYVQDMFCPSSFPRTAITVTANPRPIISVNSGSICAGQIFTIIPAGAFTYSISGNSTTVSPSANSSYSVWGTSAAACDALSPAVSNVQVLPTPAVNVQGSQTLICTGEPAILIVNGASTYTWSNAAVGSPLVVEPLNTTSYTVTGINDNGCSNDQVVTVVVDACLNLRQQQSPENSCLFPNPHNGLFIVELKTSKTITLTNVLGEVLLQKKLQAGKNQVDVTEHAQGIYFLTISDVKETQSFKVIRK
jgi:hypothetical protein